MRGVRGDRTQDLPTGRGVGDVNNGPALGRTGSVEAEPWAWVWQDQGLSASVGQAHWFGRTVQGLEHIAYLCIDTLISFRGKRGRVVAILGASDIC
jgi:hypothetical protein